LPEVYSTDLVYYAKIFISNKLAVGNYAGVSFYFNEAAAMAGKNIDTFTELIDMLAYHSQLATLLEGMKIAWPNIRNSPDILEWAVDDVTVAMSDFETFDYLEKSARNEHPDFEALLGRMRSLFADFVGDKYSDYLTRLKGESSSIWTMDAFVSSKKSADNIGQLSQEFLGYLRHHEGVSYVKGALACFDFADYLFQRNTGELKPGKGKHGSKKGRNNSTNILCPDGGTFDHYLAQKVSMFSQRIYKVGAILEFVPAWLRFLASKGLLEDGEKESTLAEIMPVQADWLQVLTKLSSDQALLSCISTTWDKDALIS
jgi:hypothetical protein